MKPGEIKCLVKLVATNDASGLHLLHQHESELAFTFPLLTSEWDPFWESARKYYILCIRKAEFSLVRIFSHAVRIRENGDQKKLCIWTLFTQCC